MSATKTDVQGLRRRRLGRQRVRRDDGGDQPRDGRGDRRGAALQRRGRRPRGRGREEGAARVARQDAEGPLGAAAQARRRARRERRGARAARVAERRQAADGVARRDAVLRRQPPLLRRRRAQASRESRPASTSRATRRSSGASRSAIVGGICPWNYPLMMAVWKMGPALAAGNVQILKPSEQTPLSLLRFVQLAQEVIPAGVLQVVTGDGVPVGRAARRAPRRAARLAHRRRRDRQGDREERGRHAEARPSRARRQGADGRLRRRRSAGGRGGHPPRRLLELRPGLHRRLARDRRAEDLRQAARGARAAGRVAEGRRPDGVRRDRDGLGHLAVAAGADPRLPRAGEGRDGAHRRRHERLDAASSCSRRSSPT